MNIDTGILVTIIIFALTNIISAISKYRNTKNNIENLKKMFIQELSINYQWLDNAMPNGTLPKPENVTVAASICRDLETFVFKEYFSKILILTPKEVKSIYDSYAGIRHISDFALMPKSDQIESPKFRGMTMANHDDALKIMLTTTYSNMKEALTLLAGKDFESNLPYPKFPSRFEEDRRDSEQT